MDKTIPMIICLVLPFLGTILGSSMVFFMRNKINPKIKKVLLGFAAGVMLAASIWSLLLPSMDMSKKEGVIEWLPAAIGFLLGMGFLLILDTIIPHLHSNGKKAEGLKSKLKKETMLLFAVTLHNIPEGMAVGVVLAGAITGNVGLSFAGAITLAIGLAIQNFPEGAIISMPLKTEGESKWKAFLDGVLSGIVEPIAAIITIFAVGLVTPILPYLLAFAAGAMIYVVVEELIPESMEGKHTNIATVGVALGFVLMMVLDITLG